MLILLTFIFLGLTIIFWLSDSYIADVICAWSCVTFAVCCFIITGEIYTEGDIEKKIQMYTQENKMETNEYVYAENVKKINELKEKKMELEDLKWWVYFGGDDESCQCEECNHQWIYLEKFNGFYVTVYCPKCKSEQNIKNKEWKKMQIDKEYQQKTEGSKN